MSLLQRPPSGRRAAAGSRFVSGARGTATRWSRSGSSFTTRPAQLTQEPGFLWRLDWGILALALLLGGLGVAMIYSASRGSDPQNYIRLYLDRQALFLLAGLALMLVVAWLPLHLARLAAWPSYAAAALLLLLVLTPLGSEQRGTQAWFDLPGFQFQVSELGKVAFMMGLASFLAKTQGQLSWGRLLTALAITAVPTGLVLLEPDVGTAVIFVVIAVTMIVVGGVQLRQAVLLGLLTIVVLGLLLSSSLLENYQQERLSVFINPDTEEVDTYNVEQARIAIGNGGFWGQGYGQGTKTQSGEVPEQHTDFIFTAIGEELGFVGAVSTVMLYLALLWRLARAGRQSRDPYSRLLAAGVLAMLAFQAFQAAGMTVGIMPVTGIPFPLLSYGGSSLLATCVALGLVLGLADRAEPSTNPRYIR